MHLVPFITQPVVKEGTGTSRIIEIVVGWLTCHLARLKNVRSPMSEQRKTKKRANAKTHENRARNGGTKKRTVITDDRNNNEGTDE